MPSSTRDPRKLTPAQRQAEVVDLLARAVVRLHQRHLVHNQPPAENHLDLSATLPLSVAKSTTVVDRPRRPRSGDAD